MAALSPTAQRTSGGKASSHRINGGFRCSVALNGEAAWDIVSRSGRKVLSGYAAE
jgi:hypothetical protein